MTRLTIAADGLDQVAARIGAYPAEIEAARKRTVTKATKFAVGEVRKGISSSLGITQKVLLDRRRIASRPGLVWIGIKPIAAVYLGKPRQTKTGAKAGRRSYKGAFIAKMPSGHVGIFRRVPPSVRWSKRRSRKWSPNLPIEEVREPIKGAVAIVESVRQKISDRIPVLFRQELNFEVNVRGRR